MYPPERSCREGFSILEMLVASVVLMLLVSLLVTVNNHTMQLCRRTTSQADAFQSARLAYDLMVRQLNQATLNVYWDYDSPTAPTRYLRKSDLAFVTGQTATLLGADPASNPLEFPGHAVFFQAPLGRLEDPASRKLNLALNTCGFYVEYCNANEDSPAFIKGPIRNRYRLKQLHTSAENMQIFKKLAGGKWFFANLAESRVLAENVLLLVIRPLAPGPNETRKDLGYSLDTAASPIPNPQPATSHQLPPLLNLTFIAASEETLNRKSPTDGYKFCAQDLTGKTGSALFTDPNNYDDDLSTFENVLKRERLDYRCFSQQIALPNSKWSD